VKVFLPTPPCSLNPPPPTHTPPPLFCRLPATRATSGSCSQPPGLSGVQHRRRAPRRGTSSSQRSLTAPSLTWKVAQLRQQRQQRYTQASRRLLMEAVMACSTPPLHSMQTKRSLATHPKQPKEAICHRLALLASWQ
jgi:hypothetical protein